MIVKIRFSSRQHVLKIWSVLILWLGIFVHLHAGTYYISPTGRPGAVGSVNDPYRGFEAALSRIGGGHTYVFLPGVYQIGQITLRPEQRGTPQNPTVLKSLRKYKAVLHGSTGHGFFVQEGADWVIIDGFEVRCSGIDGVKSNADHTVIRNCWVHHNMGQGIAAHSVRGTVIERNLVEFNGSHIQYNHGLYVSGENLVIRQNIVRLNASHGILLGPSAVNCLIENNLSYRNTRSGILLYCPAGGGQNKIIHNTIVENGFAVSIRNGLKEVIANNIMVGNTLWTYNVTHPPFHLTLTRPEDIIIKSNLIYPESSIAAADNLCLDPQFVMADKAVLYLSESSPALAGGDPNYRSEHDFFGTHRDPNQLSLGCFNYYQSLDDRALYSADNKNWHYGWPFSRRNRVPMADLWDINVMSGSVSPSNGVK